MLNVSELKVFRNRKSLIRPTAFKANKGDILRVTGENGTGKTTVLETILGVHKEWEGRLEIRASGISYKRQGTPGFESLTLSEAWKLVVGAEQGSYNRLVESLDLLEIYAKPIGILSGGEGQRVMLALALLRRHDLLLLDEPFTGIDAKSAELMSACLMEHRDSRAVILVEHKPSQRLGITQEVRLEPDLN